MDHHRDRIRRRVGRGGRSLDASECAAEKQFSRCGDQRRKRAIGIARQEPARIDDLAVTVDVVFAYDLIEHIGAAYSNPANHPMVSPGRGWDEQCFDLTILALDVVTPKIPGVRVGLIDIRIRRA